MKTPTPTETTPARLAAAIKENARAFVANEIDHATFKATARRLWNEAESNLPAFFNAVAQAVTPVAQRSR